MIKRSTLFFILRFICAISYALLLASLPIDAYVDRNNYLNYIDNAGVIFESNYSASFFSILFNEPLWLLLNKLLGYLFIAEDGLRVLIFSSALLFCYKILQLIFFRHKNFWILLLISLVIIFIPQIIKNYIIHLRQGVAIAVFFMLAGNLNVVKKCAFASFFAAQFHSSFYILFLIFSTFYILDFYGFSRKRIISIVCLILIFAVFIFDFAAKALEVRQINNLDLAVEGSGIGFIFWLIILFICLMVIRSNKLLLQNWGICFSICAVFVYLYAYFQLPYAGRIFESCLPIIFISILYISSYWSRVLYFMIASLFLYQWAPLLIGGYVFRPAL